MIVLVLKNLITSYIYKIISMGIDLEMLFITEFY